MSAVSRKSLDIRHISKTTPQKGTSVPLHLSPVWPFQVTFMPKIDIPLSELQKRKLFVATPMYGGMCVGPFAKACLDLNTVCMKYGVQAQFFFLFNESLITRARNYLVDEFLRSDART
jgi:hypothetical protein